MKKPHKSIRVFQNPWLEKLTHVHPITPLVMWTPFISWLIWRSFFVHELGAMAVGSLFFLGLAVWTLSEYLLHRFVFHFEATGPIGERIIYLMHGLHHADPGDPTRLVMPPVPGIVLASVLYLLFRIPFGPVLVEPFFASFLVGYLCYDYTHFAVHHFNPRTRFGKMLKQHHMLHHYATQDLRYGVSSPLWDYVFGTHKEAENKRQTV